MTTKQEERAEQRGSVRPFELRESGSSTVELTGYASLFDVAYEVSDFMGEYTEVVRPGAFKRTLDHGADVRLLINHDGLPLARTKSGTLELSEDDTGLLVRADLDASSPLVQSLRSAMQRGDADQMSMAFRVTRQQWSPDYLNRDILEAQLYDVSVVTFPASPTTSASLRSAAVARYGADLWAQLEDSLRSGQPLGEDAAAMLRRLLPEAAMPDTRAQRLAHSAALLGL